RVQVVEAFTSARLFADQRCLPQNLQVLRDRGSPQIELARQVRDVSRPFLQVNEQVTANRAREGGEDIDIGHVRCIRRRLPTRQKVPTYYVKAGRWGSQRSVRRAADDPRGGRCDP